ncbi:MAG: hypothetical protein RLZZ303_1530 [Candidatus Hydrogenedentota bacterium]|jgi:ribosomal protein S18 acetylase RimI-like enzyme
MKASFRTANSQDADALVPHVYASGPDTFNYVFTAPARRVNAQGFLRRALARPMGEFGYSVHLAGEVEGRIIAAGAGFDARLMSNATLPMLRSIIGTYGLLDSIGVIRRGLAVEHLLPPPKGDEWALVHLGVSEELRGHGIGGQLIEALLQRGRARGCRVAVLDVSLENPRAQFLYERMGFNVTREVTANLRNQHGHVPGFRRMEMVL